MTSILKFLNFSQRYTKFQIGVEKPLLENKFDEEGKREYLELYEEYKKHDMKTSKSEIVKAERI
jgi:hypothetical protein